MPHAQSPIIPNIDMVRLIRTLIRVRVNRRGVRTLCTVLLLILVVTALHARAQTQEASQAAPTLQLVSPTGAENTGPPLTLTLHDAVEQARKYDLAYASAMTDAKLAHEDRLQGRAVHLPQVSFTTQELLTKGNGVLPTGRYVTNDGIHVYRAWGVFHQDLSPVALIPGYNHAPAAEAMARAKAEIARRGLTVAVTKNYYALVVAQRRYASAQQAFEQAKTFLTISKEREQGGEVAHSDVIKAELQFSQEKQAYQEAQLAIDSARLALAVMLSPNLNENISVVDDLSSARDLPPFSDVRAMAGHENPDVRAALEALKFASADVASARGAFLPTIAVDTDYGIEANAFALRSAVSADPKAGVLPNLGHFVTASLNLPVWDWGIMRSKLRQAEYKRQLARIQLSQTQRQVLGNLYSFYNEAVAARSELETLHHAAELAAESLRLITMRYQAGESTILELVDAQNTLTQARNADDDGQVRYRLSLATLQTLTGNF
ncbi:MAG TPA: TolC family protein [Terriglobia bacterium]|nr:TolC family protein [Terriglobia bacterium]